MYMATYRELQKWIKDQHGFSAKTCWIAHAKELNGLSRGTATNRQSEQRVYPCPSDKLTAIIAAFKHFEML